MTPSGPDCRDLAVARVALGAAAVGVAWLAWRYPAARAAVKRGATFAARHLAAGVRRQPGARGVGRLGTGSGRHSGLPESGCDASGPFRDQRDPRWRRSPRRPTSE